MSAYIPEARYRRGFLQVTWPRKAVRTAGDNVCGKSSAKYGPTFAY